MNYATHVLLGQPRGLGFLWRFLEDQVALYAEGDLKSMAIDESCHGLGRGT